jgi:predicted AAA+ superfamily ATPase
MNELTPLLTRIAQALERLAPAPAPLPPMDQAAVWLWQGNASILTPIHAPRRVPLSMILGNDAQKERLVSNTRRFAEGHPANHGLLWGARGTGKSALVKAVHDEIATAYPSLKLIEVVRGDIATVPTLAAKLAQEGWQAIIFIDDLSFERGDESYKALKSVLDGGVSGALSKILVYVTSNRRHLVNRPDGTQPDFRPDETVEEQMALSERFGLWLGFHAMDQATWLAIVHNYCVALSLKPKDKALERTALQWAAQRGSRTGRSAWHFIVERAGELGKPIEL